jgi:thiosulfate reductase cytochrome b subunit
MMRRCTPPSPAGSPYPALSRRWHLTFAWLFVRAIIAYWIRSLVNRHIWQNLLPGRRELTPRHIPEGVKNHALLRFPQGEAARRHNTLQKLAYLGVVFRPHSPPKSNRADNVAGDGCGLALAQRRLGGRPPARSIHFYCAMLIVHFFFVHLLMVVLVGPINDVRSMNTGRYHLTQERN